jgi:Tfp pilus assembly protein PilV
MKPVFSKQTKKGFALVEAVISISILALVLTVLGVVGSSLLKSSLDNNARVQAAYLSEEGLEATRLIRDQGWTANIAPYASGSNFYLHFDGSSWNATSTNIFIDNTFERKVTLTEVRRDSSQHIVSSGGTVDPNIKKVTVSVSWNSRGATSTRSVSTYLANVFDN